MAFRAVGGTEGLAADQGPANTRRPRGRRPEAGVSRGDGWWLLVCQDHGCPRSTGLSRGPAGALVPITQRPAASQALTPPDTPLPQEGAALTSLGTTTEPLVPWPPPRRTASSVRGEDVFCVCHFGKSKRLLLRVGREGPGLALALGSTVSDLTPGHRGIHGVLFTVRRGWQKPKHPFRQ